MSDGPEPRNDQFARLFQTEGTHIPCGTRIVGATPAEFRTRWVNHLNDCSEEGT